MKDVSIDSIVYLSENMNMGYAYGILLSTFLLKASITPLQALAQKHIKK